MLVNWQNYPTVTNVAFDAFPCYKICLGSDQPCAPSDERRHLKADVAIRCGTAEHDAAMLEAFAAAEAAEKAARAEARAEAARRAAEEHDLEHGAFERQT